MLHLTEFAEPIASAGPAVAPRRAWIVRLALWPLRVLAERRALAQLGAMDDRELADIGLRRQDLRDATAIGLGDDPTKMLAARAAERWLRRR
jgi:uncharacterized protein YjiS (DUF1127 family)